MRYLLFNSHSKCLHDLFFSSKEKYAYEVVESEPFYKKTNIGLSRIRTKEVKHLQH